MPKKPRREESGYVEGGKKIFENIPENS